VSNHNASAVGRFAAADLLVAARDRRGGGRPAGRRPRGSRSPRLHALPAALLAALLTVLGVVVVPVAASAATGDLGVQGPSHSGTGTPTGTKRATSALWFNDGLWWGNLWDSASSDFHIFRFDAGTSSWVDTGVATDPQPRRHPEQPTPQPAPTGHTPRAAALSAVPGAADSATRVDVQPGGDLPALRQASKSCDLMVISCSHGALGPLAFAYAFPRHFACGPWDFPMLFLGHSPRLQGRIWRVGGRSRQTSV
jgi:hypothetical protein